MFVLLLLFLLHIVKHPFAHAHTQFALFSGRLWFFSELICPLFEVTPPLPHAHAPSPPLRLRFGFARSQTLSQTFCCTFCTPLTPSFEVTRLPSPPLCLHSGCTPPLPHTPSPAPPLTPSFEDTRMHSPAQNTTPDLILALRG